MALNKNKVNEKVQGLIQKGQWKKALDLMRQLLAEDKNDPMITLRMGDLFHKLGNTEKAAISYFRTASLFAANGLKAKAIATYKMVLRVNPDYEGVQQRLDMLMDEPAVTAPGRRETRSRPTEPPTAVDVSPGMGQDRPSSAGVEAADDGFGGYGEVSIGGGPEVEDEGPTDEGVVGGSGLDLDSFSTGGEASEGYDISELIDTGRMDDMNGEEAYQDEGSFFEPAMPDVPDLPPPHPIPLFSGIPREEIVGLISRMKCRDYSKDETIVREGEEGDSLYVVKKGTVRVVTRVKDKEVSLGVLGERDFFGEVSFLTGRPRTADIVADGPAEVLELKRQDLQELMERYPEVEASLRMFHESRVEDTLSSIKAVAKDIF